MQQIDEEVVLVPVLVADQYTYIVGTHSHLDVKGDTEDCCHYTGTTRHCANTQYTSDNCTWFYSTLECSTQTPTVVQYRHCHTQYLVQVRTQYLYWSTPYAVHTRCKSTQ